MKKLKRLIIILVAFLFAFEPVRVFASIPSEDILDMYNKNGIYYYNPDGNNDNCNSSSTTLSGSDIPEKVWNYFIQKGFTDAQVAGILGNAMVETGIEPTRASNGNYWGLFQWGLDLRVKLVEKVEAAGLGKYLSTEYWPAGASKNIPEADLDKLLQIELDFTMEENDYLDWQGEIKKANTPELAAEIFLTLFERAVGGNSEVLYYAPYAGRLYQGTKMRRDYAKEFYEKYAGKGVSVSGAAATAENGKNVSIIGDSITVGSQAAILDKFTELTASDINARVSRPWNEGYQIAQSSQNSLKRFVVFALGTNNPDGISTAQLDQLLQLIGDDRVLVLVTNYGPENYSRNNELFKEYAKKNSNIIVADWYETVSKTPDTYLYSDHVHPNEAGQRLWAEMIYDAINSNTNEVGCSVNGEFQALVKGYAWPEYHAAPWHDRMPDYAAAVTQSISEGRYVGGSVAGVPGIDCGGFVTVLVQNSGLEPNYNDAKGATDTQEAWVKSHNWQLLNGSAGSYVDTSILQPGDVAFSNGHTFIYVGEIEGFDSNIASASYSTHGAGRAPMAGKEDLLYGNGSIVRWYRNPDFNPYQGTGSSTNSVSGLVSNNAPSNSSLQSTHHLTFYSAAASENGGYAGRNASSKYNNGYLAPGQAASDYFALGTVVYVQTRSSGEASYANGKYFLITDRGAGKINGDYNLDIFHDVSNPSDNNYPPYGSSSTAKIYKVAENVSWETFKAKYGW